MEEQKAKYDEVLKIGLSKEQLEADPKKMMEKKKGRQGGTNAGGGGNGERQEKE